MRCGREFLTHLARDGNVARFDTEPGFERAVIPLQDTPFTALPALFGPMMKKLLKSIVRNLPIFILPGDATGDTKNATPFPLST